jgi:hypothetical protein
MYADPITSQAIGCGSLPETHQQMRLAAAGKVLLVKRGVSGLKCSIILHRNYVLEKSFVISALALERNS